MWEQFKVDLNELARKIKEQCKECVKCDPCCTGNIILKCIDKGNFQEAEINETIRI